MHEPEKVIWWLGWHDDGVARMRLGILCVKKARRMKDFPMVHHAIGTNSSTVDCL
jgi:hypothetical protein